MLLSQAPEPFRKAIEHTRMLSPATFDQWFAGIEFDDLTDGVLTLRSQNEFVQEWVVTNYLPTLVAKLRELTSLSIQVAWILDGQLEHPIASGSIGEPRAKVVMRASVPPPASDRPPPHDARHASARHDGARHDGARHDGAPDLRAVDARSADARGADSRNADVRSPDRGDNRADGPTRSLRFAQPILLEDLNPKQTFASFVVGPSNQLAHAAAVAAAGGGGRRYNPLFICGRTGLGKTHLMQAIAHRMQNDRPSSRILYISAERFTNEFITAIQHQRMDEFRNRYRHGCDLLLVDDIQFLAGREQTQEEFFHTFNALHGSGKQIVVTSDKYPQNLERMEDRLVSRFSWGLVADIQVPELETRVAIVRNKAQLEGIVLDDEVALYLAQVVRSNVRELEGTLIRLAAKSSLLNRPVDLAFTKGELSATLPSKPQPISVEDIQRAVCHHFHLRSSDLISKDRHKSVAFARHVAMYLCKQRLKCSFPELGRAFGNRDHTTVMSAVRKIEAQRDVDPELRAHLEALERKLADG